jgi:hypothetical protein
MCLAGEIGRLWSKDLILGKKNSQQAAAFFRMKPIEVMEHINKHEIVVDEETGTYESPDFYLNELLKLLKLLKDWMNYCVSSGQYSRQDLELAMKLNKEVRETLKTLGEFQGKMGHSSSTTINIDVINQRYMQITNLLMTEVCPECRLKVIDLMDQLESLPANQQIPETVLNI